jgi:hypothetical protein
MPAWSGWHGEKTGKARLLNILSFFDSCESPPQDLTTVDGMSIWAGDGVHLTSNARRVAARKLMAYLARGGEEGEPANKRTRLESIVPTPAPAKKKGAAAGQPPTSPPRPVPPPPPLWLSGQPPPSQRGRGSGLYNTTQMGGGPMRGNARQRQPWCRPWAERAAQRRPARPLGPLVKVLWAVHSNGNRVILLTEILYFEKKKLRNAIKLKSKKNENSTCERQRHWFLM